MRPSREIDTRIVGIVPCMPRPPRSLSGICTSIHACNDDDRVDGHCSETRRASLVLFVGLSSACVFGGGGTQEALSSPLVSKGHGSTMLWFGGRSPSSLVKGQKGPGGVVVMDAEFANVLVGSLATVAGTTRVDAYESRCEELRELELPRYRDAGACGHCGTVDGRRAFRDAGYFDFETYIRGKAILLMAPNDDRKRDTYVRNATIAIGSSILKHIVEETYTEDAEQMGISPFFSLEALNSRKDSLLSASPDLDSIREGIKSLLEYFVRKGFVRRAGISQCGVSRGDEFENHLSWYRGDSATLKYWLVDPVDGNSSFALQEQEGIYIGYISSTIAAFLRRCGVTTSSVRRIPSLSNGTVDSEECVIKRVKEISLADGRSWVIRGKKVWKPDVPP